MKTRSDPAGKRPRFGSWWILAIVVLCFYAIENWRGRRAWENLKREMAGERLELADWISEPIPDEENFAMAPIWLEANNTASHAQPALEWFESDPGIRTQNELAKPAADWRKLERVDLAQWQSYYRALQDRTKARGELSPDFPDASSWFGNQGEPATDVLLALSQFDQRLNQLREAARRPKCCSSMNEAVWRGASAGKIMEKASEVIKLRAIAKLGYGRSDLAFEDLQLGLKLAEVLRSDLSSPVQFRRIFVFESMLSVIWEGVGAHCWTEPQLLMIEEQLRLVDFLSTFDSSAKYERAHILDYFDRLQASQLAALLASAKKGKNPFKHWETHHFMPAGWFARNKVSLVHLMDRMGLPRTNGAAYYINLKDLPYRQLNIRQWAVSKPSEPYTFHAMKQVSGYHFISWYFGRIEASVRMARVACALERSRLINGRYPASLEALVPRFIPTLPQDAIGGGQLHYRPTENDRFMLYSIGWNGLDDGGSLISNPNGSVTDQEDWVWTYPVK